MKKYSYLIALALILGLILTGCSLLSNISQVPTTDQSGITYLTKALPLVNLVGLWHFDEGSGTTALDSSGNSNDGTITGATYAGSANAMFGDALSFNGSSNYVNTGSDTSFDFTGKFTVEAWINGEAFQSTYYDLVVFRGYNKWAFGVDRAKRLMFGEAGWSGYFSRQIYSDELSWTTGKWYHIAVVYDTDEKKADFYRDGVPVGVGYQSTDKLGITNSGDVTIGYPHSVSFNGIIDEVRIWNTALTADQLILYGFGGLMAPYAPPDKKTFKVGRTIPLKWQFTNLLGDSSAANPSIEIKRELSNETTPIDGPPIEVDDPGNSGYQYDSETDTWQFNWQTKNCEAGLYKIWIINDWTGQTFGPFPIWLR
jgi:hypothetical protein